MSTNKTTITTFDREDASADSEAQILRNGNVVGYIRGNVSNSGSYLAPRFVIDSYTVEMWNGDIAASTTFAVDAAAPRKARGDAIKFARAA
jgi:hypothetical protein